MLRTGNFKSKHKTFLFNLQNTEVISSEHRDTLDPHCLFPGDDLCTKPGRLSFVCFNAESDWLLQFCGSPKITVCLSFRDNAARLAKGEQGSRATIREVFSPAGERETRGGHHVHLVKFAPPQDNNQVANCLAVKEPPARELKAGHTFPLNLSLFIQWWEM